ncbi:MAG: BON domain-containing protein [Gammaproteobacteria bacterium]|nr:BON domain-containing protein [Gammaproteobacteria bacterium]
MMNTQIKMSVMSVLFFIMTLLPVTLVLAVQNDEKIQHDIMTQLENSGLQKDIQIDIHVEQRLVVLTGKVRLYEQKLNIERIAWTTPGVFEVDNELRIVPLLSLSDVQIKEKVKVIVEADDNFHVSLVNIKVDNGKVYINGSFLDFRDPSRLKHKVAAIEGVITIKIDATFLITPIKLNEVARGSRASDSTLRL